MNHFNWTHFGTLGARGYVKKKNRPRVDFFFSTIYLGLTLLCNQAHVYIRKYDIITVGTFLLLLAQMPHKPRKAIFGGFISNSTQLRWYYIIR